MDAQYADNIAKNRQATGFKDEAIDFGGSSPSHNVDDLREHNFNASNNPDKNCLIID
jgi:hypothetical protein